MAELKNIVFERDQNVATITLNRPPLNVLNIEMMKEINSVLEDLKDDRKLKVVIFRAEGKAFSAGVDVSDHTEEKAEEMIHVFHQIFFLMTKIKAPTIALVNGKALGGGCELATFCDITLASDESKFGQPEIKVGVFAPIAAVMFPRFMNLKKAMELNLTGETMDAHEAKNIGLVNAVFPTDKFDEEVKGYIEKLTMNSSVVLQLTKQAIYEALGSEYHIGVAKAENIYLNILMKTHDANEGLKAFLEKRKPVWRNE
ncbi:MAG: enoyl-CoA hydratase/isomerase family protein [Methanomassiliicoccales archaeon]|nr:MAG: enoyl-CoA hydratase/isomerase family protein [Methanomassiliicoccales archaeon]